MSATPRVSQCHAKEPRHYVYNSSWHREMQMLRQYGRGVERDASLISPIKLACEYKYFLMVLDVYLQGPPNTALNYTSALIHTAKMGGLSPGTAYEYQVTRLP